MANVRYKHREMERAKPLEKTILEERDEAGKEAGTNNRAMVNESSKSKKRAIKRYEPERIKRFQRTERWAGILVVMIGQQLKKQKRHPG